MTVQVPKVVRCHEFPNTEWETTVDGRSVTVRLIGEDKNGLPVEIAMRRRLYADHLTKLDEDGEPVVSELDPVELTERLMKEIRFEVKSRRRR